MRYTLQIQRDQVAEAVRARYSMVIPIIQGMLNSSKGEMVEALGGYEKITLEQLARIYQEQPGDYGICFEYAVHEAIRNRDASIHPMLSDVLETFCNIKGGVESILFGIEKSGNTRILETAKELLTDESRILAGKIGQPPKLKNHLETVKKAFRSNKHQEKLPQSIRGLWKADLFMGNPHAEQWVAATLKTHRKALEGAPGLRVGLYPEEKRGEGPKKDSTSNLVMCPLPYNGEFMQLFGASFQIAKQLIAANGGQPSRVALVYEDDQTVAKWLADRRAFPVLDILEALKPLRQPGLVEEKSVESDQDDEGTVAAAPIPLLVE